jgi:hypothetical protein
MRLCRGQTVSRRFASNMRAQELAADAGGGQNALDDATGPAKGEGTYRAFPGPCGHMLDERARCVAREDERSQQRPVYRAPPGGAIAEARHPMNFDQLARCGQDREAAGNPNVNPNDHIRAHGPLRDRVERCTKRRCGAAIMIFGERLLDRFEVRAKLKRDRNRDGRIAGDRLDRRSRLVRREESQLCAHQGRIRCKG